METTKLGLLRQAMGAYALRSRTLANNVANLATPGYERLGVAFEEALQQARRSPEGIEDPSRFAPRVRAEGRPPLLEDEMMELADTQMRTQLATRALSEHFALMRTGITGRPE